MQACLSINRNNARTHFTSIQDSLKSTSSTDQWSGDGRYMRNKLLKEANKYSETGTYIDDIDMESSSFDSEASSLYEEPFTVTEVQASMNLISPYTYEHDVIDETVSISETRDWLSLVEKNLEVGLQHFECASALEPTPISDVTPHLAAASRIRSSMVWAHVTSPPF